uniref:Uncharacterized protein n=1 Tax=Meloidogyne enterolobii TaxID=390850 RepID=A0A6V7U629_MELEN|nr:unnamed protein product [Meloidogyne enterolobii]
MLCCYKSARFIHNNNPPTIIRYSQRSGSSKLSLRIKDGSQHRSACEHLRLCQRRSQQAYNRQHNGQASCIQDQMQQQYVLPRQLCVRLRRPNGKKPVDVHRLPGGLPGPDRFVVQWAEVPAEESDPKAPFLAQAQSGEVVFNVTANPAGTNSAPLLLLPRRRRSEAPEEIAR